MGPFSTEKETEVKLNSGQNLLNKLGLATVKRGAVKHKNVVNGARQNGGRTSGHKNLPTFARELIAVTARAEGSKAAASAFGVSERTARNYAVGKVGGTGREHTDDTLKGKIEVFKERVQDVALEKLMKTVGLIHEDDVVKEKPETQSKIAANLAGVVSKLDKREDKHGPSVNAGVFIYAPGSRDENEYPVIPVDPVGT